MKSLYLLLWVACLPFAFLQSQTINTTIPDADNGDISVVVRQGNFLYIGGDFTAIGGTNRNGLARINMTNNTLDNTWNPDIYNSTFSTGGYVKTMAFSPDGTILYIGGIFDKVGGATGTDRVCLAAINVATAAATTWDAPTPNVFEDVKKIVVASSTGNVYVQGGFTSIYEPSTMTTFTRNGLACITAASLVTAFDPQCSNANAIREMTISSDNSRIYIGFGNASADFTDGVGGTINRQQFAELNASDGVPTTWDPSPDAGVFAIIQTGTTLYMAGGFNNIGGTARPRVAKFNDVLTTPTLDATFTSGTNSTTRGAFFDGTDLYVLGDFTKLGTTYVQGLAKLNGSTGVASNTWRIGANKYFAPVQSKLFGSATHQELYPAGFGFEGLSFLGRSRRHLQVVNYAASNTLTEVGLEQDNSATPVTLDFGAAAMVLELSDASVFSIKYPLANRYTDAPQNVSGITQTSVSNYRFVLSMKGLASTTKTLLFKLNALPSPPSTPSMVKIYYRQTPNEGTFTDAGTVTYNAGNQTLSIDVTSLSSSELIEFVFASDVTLPIEFSAFSVKKQDKTAFIAWSTVNESKGDNFEIQRSTDGVLFQTIHKQTANGKASNYTFTDKFPSENINYYRILSKNTEGSYQTTKIQSVAFDDDKPTIHLFPNPTSDVVFIQNLPSDCQSVTLTNAAGQVLKQFSKTIALELFDVPNGVYVLTITTAKSRSTHKIQKL